MIKYLEICLFLMVSPVVIPYKTLSKYGKIYSINIAKAHFLVKFGD